MKPDVSFSSWLTKVGFQFIVTELYRWALTFQSMVLKNWCLFISSTPSGPAPARIINKPSDTLWSSPEKYIQVLERPSQSQGLNPNGKECRELKVCVHWKKNHCSREGMCGRTNLVKNTGGVWTLSLTTWSRSLFRIHFNVTDSVLLINYVCFLPFYVTVKHFELLSVRKVFYKYICLALLCLALPTKATLHSIKTGLHLWYVNSNTHF